MEDILPEIREEYSLKKEYDNYIYEDGEYESLVIDLGKAKGNNWWCVVYPPLCFTRTPEAFSAVIGSFGGMISP